MYIHVCRIYSCGVIMKTLDVTSPYFHNNKIGNSSLVHVTFNCSDVFECRMFCDHTIISIIQAATEVTSDLLIAKDACLTALQNKKNQWMPQTKVTVWS